MKTILSQNELNVIRRFVKSARPEGEKRSPLQNLIPVALGICGLLLITYSTLLFIKHPMDHTAKWTLLPGCISGIVLVSYCLVSIKQAASALEKSRLAKVLRKVLDSADKGDAE